MHYWTPAPVILYRRFVQKKKERKEKKKERCFQFCDMTCFQRTNTHIQIFLLPLTHLPSQFVSSWIILDISWLKYILNMSIAALPQVMVEIWLAPNAKKYRFLSKFISELGYMVFGSLYYQVQPKQFIQIFWEVLWSTISLFMSQNNS
jgi:hypothetical protein